MKNANLSQVIQIGMDEQMNDEESSSIFNSMFFSLDQGPISIDDEAILAMLGMKE